MNKILKITLSVFLSLVIASSIGLIATGASIGWGPFSFLHTWDSDVKKIEETYPSENNQNNIIFYGASNFRMWTEMENDLSEYHVQNHGFGGSTDKDLMKYADRLLYPYNPSIIFFQTGSNDYVSLSGSNEEKVSKCIDYKQQMFEEIHAQLPDAKLVIMSGLLLPGRSEYRELTEQINEKLQEYCLSKDFLWFVDSSNMTWDGESYKEDLFIQDGIHLNHDGQLLWMNNYIQPMIEQLINSFNLTWLRKGQ